MANSFPTLPIDTYTLAPITSAQSTCLQAMLERCNDFHLLVEGEPTYPDAAQDVFESLPPGKTIADKFVLGIFDAAGRLAGVLEGVRDYPQAGVWWIGLLLLTPETRGQGLGRMLVEQFSREAAALGAGALMLGVVEENQAGRQFWEGLGFTWVRQTEPRPFGKKTHVVHVLRLDLPARYSNPAGSGLQ